MADSVIVMDTGKDFILLLDTEPTTEAFVLTGGGPMGMPGTNGTNGRNPEFQQTSTHIQWRYVGDSTWINLVPLSAITGPAGTNGTNGSNGSNGTNGRGITSIARTSGTGAAGTTDTYTITYSDATTSTFAVYNGADGTGGGGGGGGGATWTSVINDPLSTTTNLLTALSGTWAINSGVLRQSNAGIIAQRAHGTAVTPTAIRAVECEMAYISGSGTRRMGLQVSWKNVSGGNLFCYLESTDGTTWTLRAEVEGVVLMFVSSATISYSGSGYVKFGVIQSGTLLDFYINGVWVDSLNSISSNQWQSGKYVGLNSMNSVVDFRNLKAWSFLPENPSSTSTSTGILLIDNGTSVPSGTPSGTIIYEKSPDPTTYDFTTGALPSGWSKHGAPTETFSGSGMASTFSATQGYHHTLPVSGSSDFTVEMKMTALGSTGTMFGPGITDSSGNGVQCSWYNAPAGVLTEAVSSYGYASSFTNGGGTFAVPNRLRIKKVGTSYTSSYSFDDGASWSSDSPALSSSATMTQLTIGSAFGGSTVTVTEVKVTVVGSGTGVAKGWWNGTTLQGLG